MQLSDLSNLTDRLKESRISLGHEQSTNYAWSLKDTYSIVKLIEQNNKSDLVILGGDLLVLRENEPPEYIYANWYYDANFDENDKPNSIAKTINYLGQFDNHPDKKNIIVDLAVSNIRQIQETREEFPDGLVSK